MKKHKTRPRIVQEIMNHRIEALSPDAEITGAIHTLIQRDFAAAPVVDADGSLLGILTEHDCIRVLAEAVYEGWPTGHVEDHMTRDIETVDPHEDVFAVATRFTKGRHRRLAVVDDGRLVGLVTRRDIVKALDTMRVEVDSEHRPTTYELIEDQRES